MKRGRSIASVDSNIRRRRSLRSAFETNSLCLRKIKKTSIEGVDPAFATIFHVHLLMQWCPHSKITPAQSLIDFERGQLPPELSKLDLPKLPYTYRIRVAVIMGWRLAFGPLRPSLIPDYPSTVAYSVRYYPEVVVPFAPSQIVTRRPAQHVITRRAA